jgi:hypothetical protein
MNDFERKLARQEFRAIPAEWRAEILPSAAPVVKEPRKSWLDWLWPAPRAWGAVAALWLIAGGLSLLESDPPSAPSTIASDHPAPAPSSLYALHPHELRLLLN